MVKLILLIFVFTSCNLFAADKVRVLALFPGKAMLEINGKRKVVSVGQSPHSGITLLQANPRFAEVMIHGRSEQLTLGSAVNSSFAENKERILRLLSDKRDSFHTDALVNGQPMRMLVDTGATTVAMSELHARSLGIDYVAKGRKVSVGTASGSALGFEIRLRSLKIGEVLFNNVKAIVIQGNSPHFMLLGMNILSRFQMEQKGKLLILKSI